MDIVAAPLAEPLLPADASSRDLEACALSPVPGARFFDLSVSGRPGPSEVAGGRGKRKTENKRGGPGPGMKNQKNTRLAPGPPWGTLSGPRPKSSRLSRGGPGLPAGSQCFSGLSSGRGRGHFSLENGLSDTWIAKVSRCARLRTWGSAPQESRTSRTLTPSLWRRRRHPVSLDRGPRGPQEAETCFVLVFYAGGPGPQKWREGGYSPRDQHRSPQPPARPF